MACLWETRHSRYAWRQQDLSLARHLFMRSHLLTHACRFVEHCHKAKFSPPLLEAAWVC